MNHTTVITCQCGSSRWMEVSGECERELFTCINFNGKKHEGCVIPEDCNIGVDEFVSFTMCLNCGHVQGDWPVREDIILNDVNDNSDSSGNSNDSDSSDVNVVLSTNISEPPTPYKEIKVRPFVEERNLYLELVHNLL